MKRLFAGVSLLVCTLGLWAQNAVVMNVNLNEPGIQVSPTLYGLFYEEINHAGEGGLYAELISNRSFEDENLFRGRRRRGENAQQLPENSISNWSLQVAQGDEAKMSLEKTPEKLLNKAQKNALKLEVTQLAKNSKVILKNSGFWGINAVKGQTYKLSFWACSDKKYNNAITVGLMNSENGTVYASQVITEKIGKQWKKYTAEFVADADDAKACFFLEAGKEGTLYLDMVSLFPPTFKDRENGCRIDLAQKLADMHPQFVRFPGGCFVEGSSKESAFNWRITVGPQEERPGHNNLNWGYRCTDGFGYHEMLQLTEDLGAVPLFVVNVGIWHGGFVPHDSIDEYIQTALDAIEYANGDASTKYGAMRIANGHPEPFNMTLIEVGNENYQPDARSQSDHYAERYVQFYNAIKAKYPYMQIIGNVESWGTDYPSWRNEHPVDLLDEHYYRTPSWFAQNFHKYDGYDRKGPKIYVGEYAVTSDCGQGNLNAALGEAIYMMGMENNSDVVTMCSYAPIFVNWNDRRWMPDMIRFNSAESYGSPSYWVQNLFSNNVGTRVVKNDLTVPVIEKKPEYMVGVGSWLTGAEFKEGKIYANGDTIEIPFTDKTPWTASRGEWAMNEGVYSQTSRGESCTSVYTGYKITSERYTYTVKARKTSGDEGFLVLFNASDDKNFCWFNVGGWGNTRNAVEDVHENGKVTLATAGGAVEAGVWYDVRIEVDGRHVQCFLNNELVNDFTIKEMQTVYANATLDEKNNELIVKMVNFSGNDYPCHIDLNDTDFNREVSFTTLKSAAGTDENTMENPSLIVPSTKKVSFKKDLKFKLSPYSVNILRIGLK